MKCIACGNNLNESEQKFNEWGFLETMCKKCLEIGRSAVYDSEIYDLQIAQHDMLEYDESIPGWATTTKVVGDYLIAFEQEPLWDEDTKEWVVKAGKAQPISFMGDYDDSKE